MFCYAQNTYNTISTVLLSFSDEKYWSGAYYERVNKTRDRPLSRCGRPASVQRLINDYNAAMERAAREQSEEDEAQNQKADKWEVAKQLFQKIEEERQTKKENRIARAIQVGQQD